jgi:hypothetical protein
VLCCWESLSRNGDKELLTCSSFNVGTQLAEKTISALNKLRTEECERRNAFQKHYGRLLPETFSYLEDYPHSVQLPRDFDTSLPDIPLGNQFTRR